MTILQKVLREYSLIMAAVTAGLAMALGLNWVDIDSSQLALVLAFIAAVFVLLRFVVTPVASPNLPIGTIVNAASSEPTGIVTEQPSESSE